MVSLVSELRLFFLFEEGNGPKLSLYGFPLILLIIRNGSHSENYQDEIDVRTVNLKDDERFDGRNTSG